MTYIRGVTPAAMRIGKADKPGKNLPELPAWKAFVVQFSREASAHGGKFSGRIEHLSSGRRARFDSKEELLTSLEKLLDEVGADEEGPKR